MRGHETHLKSMKLSEQPTHIRRRLVALAAAALVAIILTAIGGYGLLIGPRITRDATVPGTENDPVPAPSTAPAEVTIPNLSASTDPETFARNVAEALFTWDTGSGLMPLDYTAPILEFADPAGTEQAGLASDIASYLPDRDAWTNLRQYATAQSLSIDDAYVPEAWDEALAQARPGQLPDGAIAVTIEGTRHRTGVWNDEPVQSAHPVAFTVFLTCPDADAPTTSRPDGDDGSPAAEEAPTCFVMRLSILDKPLR
ncbi:hypothetical protein [Brevibacterium casei]